METKVQNSTPIGAQDDMQKRELRLSINRFIHGAFVIPFVITIMVFLLLIGGTLLSFPQLLSYGPHYSFLVLGVLVFGAYGTYTGLKNIDQRWVELSSRIDKWGISAIPNDTFNISVMTVIVVLILTGLAMTIDVNKTKAAIEYLMCIIPAIAAALAIIFSIVYAFTSVREPQPQQQ